MNTLELRAELIRNGKTYNDIAKDLGISISTIKRKINNEAEFKWSEILMLRSILNLSDDRFKAIFFND